MARETGTDKGRKFALGFESIVPHIAELGMRAVEIGARHAIMALPYQARLVGDPETGVLHGGAVTTLIDSACGLAVLAAMAEPGPTATLDLRIDYLRPATPGEELLARAECYRMTRRIAFVRATAYHAYEADQVAAALASFIIKGQGGGLEADGKRNGGQS